MPTMLMEDREVAAVGYLEERLNCPAFPPREWFEEIPDWYDPKMGLVQVSMGGSDEGRVAALVAPWNECILDGKAGCWTAPASLTGYEYAHVGAVQVDSANGPKIRTANIGGKVNHADIRWPMRAAVDHYANTATRTMTGRYIDTPDGIMFLGMMVPTSTRLDALTVMASALSGDWRWVETLNAYEMAGSQLVNNPAFRPLPSTSAEFAITASLPNGITASLDSIGVDEPPAAVFGTWTFAEPPTADGLPRRGSGFVEAGRDIERLGAIIASLSDRLNIPDIDDEDDEDVLYESNPPTATIDLYDVDEDGDIDMDDVVLIARSIFGCERCGGDGCRHCRHTGLRDWSPADDLGYDMADELDGIEGDDNDHRAVSGDVYDLDTIPVVPDIVPVIPPIVSLIESGAR